MFFWLFFFFFLDKEVFVLFHQSKRYRNLRSTFVWSFISKTVKLSAPALCLSSLYTRANITRASRPLRFHLTTASRRIPPHVMFFSNRIGSICRPVISVNHSLAKMCFALPRVRMCLHCGGRQSSD